MNTELEKYLKRTSISIELNGFLNDFNQRKDLQGIAGVLVSFIKGDDKQSYRRFISKWTEYLTDTRDGLPEWGKNCLEVSKAISPDPSWLVPWVEPKTPKKKTK